MSDKNTKSREPSNPGISKEVLGWERFAEMDYVTANHLDKTLYPKPMEIICIGEIIIVPTEKHS